MKIDRVIFSLNSSPLYSGMWDITSEVYAKTTSITPTLMFYGTEEELQKEVKCDYGEVYLVPKCQEVIQNPNLDWSVTWVMWWAAANLFPDDICLTSGIDEIPISNVLWDKIDSVSDDKYVVSLGRDPYGHSGLHGIVASGFNCGKGSLIKEIFEIEDDLHTELNKLWQKRYEYSQRVPRYLQEMQSRGWWGLDEAYISNIVYDHPDVVIFDDEWVYTNLQSRKIDRANNCSYDLERLKRKDYWGAHLVRPATDQTNKYIINQILKNIGVK